MAAKRLLEESGNSEDHESSSEKRVRSTPSFASIIGQAVLVNTLNNFFSSMEPMLRRVINEEIEQGLQRCTRFSRSASICLQDLEPSSLQLVFSEKLSLPIFTGTKIVDSENNPLLIRLVDKNGDNSMIPTVLSPPIKIEIVVLDGDFPGDKETWSTEEFNRKIVKERTGKRPLLTGELSLTMRDGYVAVGDIEFTDNSSWIRSRRFRIGARVAPGSSSRGLNIGEGMTDAFVVKDHRGELYKKHHPPMLEDEVWRLEKIGKDGAFHRKLQSEGINTVQDFLKLSVVDPNKLRKILGVGMSEKTWEVTIKHARQCVMGNKYHVLREANFTIYLNPICQVVRAMQNGLSYSSRNLSSLNKGYIENLVKQAYNRWAVLEVVDGLMSDPPSPLTQGDVVEQFPSNHQQQSMIMRSIQLPDKPVEANYFSNTGHVGNSDWMVNTTAAATTFYYEPSMIENGNAYNFFESSSDGDLTPRGSFINGP